MGLVGVSPGVGNDLGGGIEVFGIYFGDIRGGMEYRE